MSYMEKIRGYVIDNFLFGDGGQLQDDTSFMENGIVDSTGILELITFMEETYDFKIEDEELIPENLDTLASISNFLQKKLGRDDAGAAQSGKEEV